MKSMIIVALALVAVAVAVPVEKEAEIIKSDINQLPDGSYTLSLETDDGTKREEQGKLKTVPNEENKPVDVVVVRGSYSYINTEGNLETISYEADENGYRAEGPSVPKAPSRR